MLTSMNTAQQFMLITRQGNAARADHSSGPAQVLMRKQDACDAVYRRRRHACMEDGHKSSACVHHPGSCEQAGLCEQHVL